jgi:5-methylcytosine-specific restriction endonuclease McrA
MQPERMTSHHFAALIARLVTCEATMKTCTTCGACLPISEFNKDRQKKDGLNPRCKSCSRAWHHKNKGRVSEYQKNYYCENIEYHKSKSKSYRLKNRDRINQVKREWYNENKDKAAQYRKERSPIYATYARNRRAKVKGSGGEHTIDDIVMLERYQGMKCAICNCELKSYHVDHIVPISKGGGNDFYNLQLLCAPCNLSKNDTDPIEYNQQRGLLL